MKQLTFIFAVLFSISSYALVDMRNANYTNSWTDLELPNSGYDLKVSRTYNSKSLFEGMFGYGWCSDFETTLKMTGEGNIKITECGAGQEVYYTPREFGRKEIDKTIAQIIQKMKEAKKGDEKQWKQVAEDMVWDHDLRSKFAFAYKVSVPVKEGTQFFANGKEVENIVLSKGIYTRYLADGSYMRFNSSGQLVQQFDKNGNFLKFDYDKDALREVVDNNGRKLVFKYYTNKKVKSINGPNSLMVEYKYQKLDDLSYVKNAWGNIYTYDYDDSHNMIKSTNPDKTFIAMTYDKKNDWVTSFTDKEKCHETYKYEFDEKSPRMHYWSHVKKLCGKDVVNESKHEFWYAERKDGQNFLQRVVSTVNGDTTDISYHDTFGKPISIKRNNNAKYIYDYYANGQIKTKNSEFLKLHYKYDTKSGKVNEVIAETLNNAGKIVVTKKSNFKYDNKGNLSFAENSDGQQVTMTYDTRGRISTILDQAKKVVKIEYEEKFGKPSIVSRPGLGKVTVTYKSNGEVDKAVSPEGPSIAMQVASTFNNLLDVISPATAEIYN